MKLEQREAAFWVAEADGWVVCELCPTGCRIGPGQRGGCGVRESCGGVLVARGYGQVSSWGLDPVEKKPLYHFHPGGTILSVGTVGCNLACPFCQNWHISQGEATTSFVSPDDLVRRALSAAAEGSIGVAFTYSEPTVWFEYVLDCAIRLQAEGQKVVLVTNGYMRAEPLQQLLPYVDAVNIDVKGFTEAFYREVSGGTLAAVKATVEGCIGRVHVEVTNLLIPGLNDSAVEVAALARWLALQGLDIPLHLSRYFPNYRMTLPPTPIETLVLARKAALEHLSYVYLGNADVRGAADTHCPSCERAVVMRRAGVVDLGGLCGDSCRFCGHSIALVR